MENQCRYWYCIYLHPLTPQFCPRALTIWHYTLLLRLSGWATSTWPLTPAWTRLHINTPVPTQSQSTRFAKLVENFNLVDTWRSVHPDAQAYSCFSSAYHSMSRIDLLLISSSLLPRLQDAGIFPRSLSDHSPCWTTLRLPYSRLQVMWQLNPFWFTLLPEDDDIHTDWGQKLYKQWGIGLTTHGLGRL